MKIMLCQELNFPGRLCYVLETLEGFHDQTG